IPLQALEDCEFVGELALTGQLREVDGVLPVALASAAAGRRLVGPAGIGPEAAPAGAARVNVARTLTAACAGLAGRTPRPAEAALAGAARVHVARTLSEVWAGLAGRKLLPAAQAPAILEDTAGPDMRDVRGQLHARRALEIAAAGAHHLLLVGPPGCGKTLLASRLPGLLPPASEAEALETAAVQSLAGSGSGRGFDPTRWRQRPFRAPHRTASAVALAGGGGEPRPGEISLAHNGVLFLDELPEWRRSALEVLREPLEAGRVTVSRAARSIGYPARFQLVAAMNPCPCGLAGDPSGRCSCTPDQIARYRGRVSGPLLDRIDLHVDVPRLPPSELRADAPAGEDSARIRGRVIRARARQLDRGGRPNALLDAGGTHAACLLSPDDQRLLERAVEQLQLSARSMHRILRVARTIADLADCDAIATAHLAEAIGYRRMDRRQERVPC